MSTESETTQAGGEALGEDELDLVIGGTDGIGAPLPPPRPGL